MVAALYVQTGGGYFGLPDVDPWDARRDARRYPGPFSVVAHPPCERWCRFAPMAAQRAAAHPQAALPGLAPPKEIGDDEGCFEAALAALHRWGGVLEHPASSYAWAAYGLAKPPKAGWARSGAGWVCEVSQGQYGHRADKLTWLYYVGQVEPPALRWGLVERVEIPWIPCPEGCGSHWCAIHKLHVFECECPPIGEWTRNPYKPDVTPGGRRRGVVETMTHRERAATPPAFRDLLLSIARGARGAS
jgi:hypothetical protein